MKSRMILVCLLLCFFYLVFVIQGARLQFFPEERLTAVKKQNFEKVIRLKPRRGIIYDRKGRELAISVAAHSLFADPFLIKDPYAVAKKLSQLLNQPFSSLYKKVKNKKKRFVWIKRHIEEESVRTVRSWKIRGLAFLQEPKRVYPNGSLLAQTLGFVGHDGQGLEGLELVHEKILRGQEKQLLVRKDAMGRPLLSEWSAGFSSFNSNGADIYLTIDSDLQFFFEKELKNVVHEYTAKSALGLIMDPQTGEIMALAHYPTFNPNHPFKSDRKLWRNRSITDAFEPGSTLKPFIMASALKKKIAPSTRFSGHEGRLSVEGHIIKEAESSQQFEDMTLRDILSYSSNIGSAQVALNTGDSFLYKTLDTFGFGQKTGIDFPGESAGILHPPPWKKLQLATIGFGHAISVTPLQMGMAYSTIAGGGLVRKARLLKEIHYKEEGRKKVFKPQVLKQALTEEEARTLTVMLISAVKSERGTGRKARVKGFLSAGKTGTAQVVDSAEGGYIQDQYISSFAGFLPAHDPRFVIHVVVRQPQKKFYGSTVAAPVFAKVAEYAVRQAGLSPVLISEKNLLKKKALRSLKKKPKEGAGTGQIPDFIGLSLREAYQLAKVKNIHIKTKGSGQVLSSHPPPLSPLPDNKKVTLTLKE